MLILKVLFIFLYFFKLAFANCQAPGQGFLEERLKSTFHIDRGEAELKEWVMHPKNNQARNEIRSLDRKIKFAQFRLQREDFLKETKIQFEKIIQNNERTDEIENFPAIGSNSKLIPDEGNLSIEMEQLPKEKLDVLPKEILDKLASKVRVNYKFPYDKFEYILTYSGTELPMKEAFLKIQGEMEEICNLQMKSNHESREWYNKSLKRAGFSPYNPAPNGNNESVKSSGQ